MEKYLGVHIMSECSLYSSFFTLEGFQLYPLRVALSVCILVTSYPTRSTFINISVLNDWL